MTMRAPFNDREAGDCAYITGTLVAEYYTQRVGIIVVLVH
jgi:hypothetical protein